MSYDELLLPVESFRCFVSSQGHAGLDPTSDRGRIQPRRIWPPHTPSPVSSASSSPAARLSKWPRCLFFTWFFFFVVCRIKVPWIQSSAAKKRRWEVTVYRGVNGLVPLLLCPRPALTILETTVRGAVEAAVPLNRTKSAIAGKPSESFGQTTTTGGVPQSGPCV